jgi:hypothetical protein
LTGSCASSLTSLNNRPVSADVEPASQYAGHVTASAASPPSGWRLPRALVAPIEFDLRPLRWPGAAMLVLGATLPHVPGNPGVPCPLRSVTGVPCPLCGLTTSVKAVMRADLGGAATANPLGIVAVAVALLLLLHPQRGNLRLPSIVLVLGICMSWVLQLHRFHFL